MIVSQLKYSIIGLLFFLAFQGSVWAQDSAACPCCEGSYLDFDFWIGNWEVHAPSRPDSILGYNQIEKIQEGCILQENWESARGPYTGSSYNWYDRGGDSWHQLWIDSQGSSLQLQGAWNGEAMVMGSEPGRDGPMQRISWTPGEDGSVRQHWQQSEDKGRSWQTIFDGIYVPKE